LSNNAGISDGGGAIDELDELVWDRVIAVNLTAAFLLARRVVAGMLKSKSGVIVNMSSVAGLRGGRTGVAYTASKWALVGMAQNIASSLGPEGIRAYAICPGVVSGAVVLGAEPPTPRGILNRGRDQQQPPPTTAQDVANLVAFLVSDESRHLNGIAVPIDSGWLAY
jgi:NAD(P)-dependent dehydrogenase (short-subunit alcohol dehydrogenase family)